MELLPGAQIAGVPHTAGTREYLTCERGRIELVASGERWELSPGDALVFRGDQRHGYRNLDARRPAVAITVAANIFTSAKLRDVRMSRAGVVLDDMGAGSDRLRGRPWSDAGETSSELEVFTGGAIACRLDFLTDVGGFDERFFLSAPPDQQPRRPLVGGERVALLRHLVGFDQLPDVALAAIG